MLPRFVGCSVRPSAGLAGARRAPLSWVAAALVALLAAGCSESPEGGAGAMPALPVLVAQAQRQDVPLYIEMVGSTLGNQEVPIRARVEGFLESVDFEEGRFVSTGDLLYTIDAQPFQAKLVEAQSELAKAQTQLVKAESDLSRIRPLAEINAVSQQQLDSAVAQEAAARAAVKAAQAGVELAQIELSYTRIVAPIDGLIGLTKAKPGEFVGRDPNPVVLNTLADIDPIRVRFSISEREYLAFAREREIRGTPAERDAQIEQDEQVPLTLILSDGTEYDQKGYLDGSAQSIDPTTGTFTLEARFPNGRNFLLPGQFARVKAMYRLLENAVVIPRKALLEIQGRYQVYVVAADNTVDVVEVWPGDIKGNAVVIEQGLAGGETLVVEGIQKVRPGMAVVPQPWQPEAERKPMQET